MEKSRKELEFEKSVKVQTRNCPKNKRATIVELTTAALMAAVLCVLAPHTLYLPLSPVGITLGSFLVYLTGLLLGVRLGCISLVLYLCMGFLGLPVFSGYTAGAGVLFGPTGGFLLGYVPCVAIVGRIAERKFRGRKGTVTFFVGTLAGTLGLYVCGTVWFVWIYGGASSLSEAVKSCILPFLIFDSVKIGLATVLYQPFRRIAIWLGTMQSSYTEKR